MILITIILISIIAGLFIYIYLYKKEVKNIVNEIRKSNYEEINLRVDALNNELEDLANEINKISQKNLERNIKIRRIDNDLKLSIANMSHDLRTPLTSILGYIQILKRRNLSEEDRYKYIDIIYKKSDHLNKLIRSFYELSRLQCDEYKFKLESINLRSLLCDTLALSYEDFVNKGIEPVVEIDEEIPKVICDEEAVTRIFSNLTNNMFKYGKGDFYISLKKENNKVISTFKNKVEDFTEEDVERIFQRFYTKDSTRTNNSTGLGLSIVKAFVEKMGHNIQATLEEESLVIKIYWNILKDIG